MRQQSIPYALRRRETVGLGLMRILETMGQDTRELAAQPEDQLPESIHQIRTLLKRFRAYLWFLRPVLGPARYGRGKKRLSQAARQLSQARDLDVIQSALTKAASPSSHEHDLQALRQVSQAFATREAARSKTNADLRDLLKEAADAVARVVSQTKDTTERMKRKWPSPKDRIAKALRTARKAKKKTLRENDPGLVHEWRKKTKRFFYVLQLTHRVSGNDNGDGLKKVDQLQEILGAHQDSMVAENYLHRHRGDFDPDDVDRAIHLLKKKRKALLDEACKGWRSVIRHF